MSYTILSKARTSIAQMKAWARSKGAYEFEKLAEPCYKASLETGVDPAISYALSAKETGWCYKNGRSTAGLDASYHNPAGLKVTKGGSDYDKNAHKRFKNWKEGYLAQQQHLALYAGKQGYPLSSPLDPRHFSYLFGKARTVVELGGKGKWNNNSNYGKDVERLVNDLLNTKYEKEVNNFWKDLVVYNGDADVFAGVILSQKLKCPLIKKSDYSENKYLNTKVHFVGGKTEDKDRFTTFKNVATLL